MLKWSFLLSLFFSFQAEAVRWDYRNTFESYLLYTHADPIDNDLNPGNQIFSLPSQTGLLDLRDDFNLLTPKTKWVVRPRWTLTQTEVEASNPDSKKSSAMGKLDLTAGYVDWNFAKKWQATVGLQVYQWGPGEFISPSNVFFHFANDQKSFAYVQKGLVLTRLNYTPQQKWSVVLIAEPVSNNETPFQVEKEFQPKSTLKVELRGRGSSQLGGVIGTEGYGRPFIGEYANLNFNDVFSLYFDLRHSSGRYSYDPVARPTGYVELAESDPTATDVHTLANAGMRFEGRVDFRIEWFYNGMGWNADDLKSAIGSMTLPNPYLANNIKHYLHSGLELPGQNYLYASLRIPDLGKKKDANLYLRNVLSIQDQSGIGQISADKAFGDSWTGYIELIGSYGKPLSEMRLLYDIQGNVGLRWAL